MNKNRIAIGAAQFGSRYGIANRAGEVSTDMVGSILDYASSQGINTIDTAISYGDSEEKLGACGCNSWRVITKIPEVPPDPLIIEDWIFSKIEDSLNRLKIGKLSGILLHKPGQLLRHEGKAIYKSMMKLKKAGYTDKIGISIYNPAELDELIKEFDFDIVQSPLSIIDTRIIDSGWADQLLRQDIELHIRSIFLQGLLLMSPADRPRKFDRWQDFWNIWDHWLAESNLTPFEACVSSALSFKEPHQIIVGFESMGQLKDICTINYEDNHPVPDWSEAIDNKLLDPSEWVNL